HYWLAVFPFNDDPQFAKDLLALGMEKSGESYVFPINGLWENVWKDVRSAIRNRNVGDKVQAALLPSEARPDPKEFDFARKGADVIDKMADSLWLGEALLEDRIVCYMQPVLDKRGKIFGYEAFARMETADAIIGGGKIIEASKYLNAEY